MRDPIKNNKKLCSRFLQEKLAFYLSRRNTMSNDQLQRLQNDSAELENYAQKLTNEGKLDLVKKIKAKKQYLDNYITTKSQIFEVA